MTEPGLPSRRAMAAFTVGSGVFLAAVTLVAGELDRLYSGDHSFWRTELVLATYAALWFPLSMVIGGSIGKRIFGGLEGYHEFNRALKPGAPPSGVDTDVLRGVIRLRNGMNVADMVHGVLNAAIAVALVIATPFQHWITAGWFAIGAIFAVSEVRRTRKLTKGLVAELDSTTRPTPQS